MTNRYPRVGDILVVNVPTHHNRNFVGVINKINLDKWGFQGNIFVSWQTDPAWGYNPEHGYAGLNLLNLRSQFKIFRNGQEIK